MVTEAGTTGEDRGRPPTSQFSQWPGFCSSFYLVKMIFNKREREKVKCVHFVLKAPTSSMCRRRRKRRRGCWEGNFTLKLLPVGR